MNWKKQNKYRMGEEEQQLPMMGPLIINTEQMQSSAALRVMENTIFFYDDISNDAILELNRILMEVDTKLQNTKNILGDCFDPVIHLRIKTDGGEIYSALSTVDLMPCLKSKVYTYVDGLVASAGTLISLTGKRRFMGKHANLLIHQLSGDMYGKYSEMEDTMESCNNLMKLLKGFYKQNTKIPMKKLDELMKRDIYLSAQECLEFGIIDEIL
jgi:ATP-dependent Clp endopeptidase proteolytic subunit ClpP